MRSLLYVATAAIVASAASSSVTNSHAQQTQPANGQVTKAMYMVTGLH